MGSEVNTAAIIHQAFVPTSPRLSSAGFHLCTQSTGRSLIHPFEKPENRAGIYSLYMCVAANARCHPYSHIVANKSCRCTHPCTSPANSYTFKTLKTVPISRNSQSLMSCISSQDKLLTQTWTILRNVLLQYNNLHLRSTLKLAVN